MAGSSQKLGLDHAAMFVAAVPPCLLQLTREVYDFFPLNRALSLQQEEDSNEVKLETLMHHVAFLVSKMKQDVSFAAATPFFHPFYTFFGRSAAL